VGGPRLLSLWFRGTRQLGLSMAFYSWAFTAGVYLGLTFLSRIAVHWGWRAPLFFLACLAVLATISMWVVASTGSPSAEARGVSQPPLKMWHLGASIWIVAIVYLFYNASTDAYYTFSPSYLVTRGYGLARASAVVGFYAWFAFVLKPIFAIFLRRGTACLMVIAGTISAITGYFLLAEGLASPYISSALIGVSIALAMPSLFALPAFLLPSRLSGMGYGLLALFLSFELFTTPAVGYTVDRTHVYRFAYVLMSIYGLIALAGAIYLHFHLHKTPQKAY
jgi:hypothetical protein